VQVFGGSAPFAHNPDCPATYECVVHDYPYNHACVGNFFAFAQYSNVSQPSARRRYLFVSIILQNHFDRIGVMDSSAPRGESHSVTVVLASGWPSQLSHRIFFVI
jgi:hypothetical protein